MSTLNYQTINEHGDVILMHVSENRVTLEYPEIFDGDKAITIDMETFDHLVNKYLKFRKIKMKKWNELGHYKKLAFISLYPEEALKDDHWEIRLAAYEEIGFTKEALKDKNGLIRRGAYRKFGFTKVALKDPYSCIRLEYYRRNGFTEEALKDESWLIRFEAYRELGFTKEALKDEDSDIRLAAYRVNGYTEEALKDKDSYIRLEAEIYFKNKGE